MNVWVIILFILYAVASLINPQKAFFAYAILKPLINKNFALISSPGLPLLSLDMAISIFTLSYFIAFRRDKISFFKSFPLKWAFYFYLSSLLFSTLFSTIGLSQSIVRSIAIINNDWLFALLFWMIITQKKDLILLFRCYLVIYSIMAIYGLIENNIGYNPIMEFEGSLIQDSTKIITFFYESDNRLGMGRIQSFTTHAITYGGLLAILLVSYYQLYLNYKEWKKSIVAVSAISLLSMFNIIFTNSRSPIVLLFVGFIGLLSLKNTKLMRFLVIGGGVFVIVLIMFNNSLSIYYENITSIFSPEASSVGGSDLTMRSSQFLAAFGLFQSHPIFGLGIGSLGNIFLENVGIYGAESVWLWIIIEQGLWGVLCYLVFIFNLYYAFHLKNNLSVNKYFIFMISGWLFFVTATGEMGTQTFLLTIFIIIYRLFSPTSITENAKA